VVAWAANTYGGHLDLERNYLDELHDYQGGPFDFTVLLYPADTGDLAAGSLITTRLVLTGLTGSRFNVEWSQDPSEANDWTGRLRITRVGTGPADWGVDVYATFYTEGQASWVGLIDHHTMAGTDSQAALPTLVSRVARWTGDHRLRGVAYAYVRYTYSADGFPRGVPTATWDIKGRKVYDPRTTGTSWSDNPALAIRDYLTNDRYGRGVPESAVDDASIIAAANYCDEMVDEGAGGTVKRYTCNGALDTSKTALSNMERLLRTCRGWLTYTAGTYRLVLDKAESSVFTFDQSNIAGAWEISLGDSRTLANQVRAKFYNPALDWLEDYQIADSPELRAEDAGQSLTRDLALELVTEPAQAYRLALLELNASRQAIRVQFDVLPKGLVVQPCDVVTVEHPRPGWSAGKLFRVEFVTIKPDGAVRVGLVEYAAAVYTADMPLIVDPAPNTELPSPRTCGQPGTVSYEEQLYQTRGGRGVAVRLLVSWRPPANDPYVRSYELDRLDLDEESATWHQVATTYSPSWYDLDMAPGRYLYRVRAVNSLGVRSVPMTGPTVTVVGLSAPPADIADLSAAVVGGVLVLTWAPVQDLDVVHGGNVLLRHVADGVTPATWNSGQDVATVAGGSASAALPALTGTYLARAIDSSGTMSETPAEVEVTATDLLGLTSAGSWDGPTDWTGTHTNTEVDSGELTLDAAEVSGTWESGDTLDLGSSGSRRLIADITAIVGVPIAATWDDGTTARTPWTNGPTSTETWPARPAWRSGWPATTAAGGTRGSASPCWTPRARYTSSRWCWPAKAWITR